MSFTSTLQFSISSEKNIALERLKNTIFIIRFGIQDGFEGFSQDQGEKKSLEELCTRLEKLIEKINNEDASEDLSEQGLFTELSDETIDLESDEIEFEDSICNDGYSIIVYCSFHCRSKSAEGIVNRANEIVGNNMDVSNICINDYDEHYIEMEWSESEILINSSNGNWVANELDETAFSSSSDWNRNHAAKFARFDSKPKFANWSAGKNEVGEWLQIDLGETREINAVRVQGRFNHPQWVTKYDLWIGEDLSAWKKFENITGPNGQDEFTEFDFSGEIQTARYLRFLPTSWENHISMRVDVALVGVVKERSIFVVNDIQHNGQKEDQKEIKIGNQFWMQENLNVDKFRNGDNIPQAKSAEEWVKTKKSKTPAWCYYNYDPSNEKKYGKLYNWFAVNDPRIMAPIGYHIPSDNDWTNLNNYLGLEDAGVKIKSDFGWENNNNGNNESGFSGHPGGYVDFDGNCVSMGKSGVWWTSTSVSSSHAKYRWLDSRKDIRRSDMARYNGCSVRCIKDHEQIDEDQSESIITIDDYTVIADFRICFEDYSGIDEVIKDLEKLKEIIISRYETFGFQIIDRNEIIEGKDCEHHFNSFIDFIRNNVNMDESESDATIPEDNPYHYEDRPELDLYYCDEEWMNLEIRKSFSLTNEYIGIFIHVSYWNFVSELEDGFNHYLEGTNISHSLIDSYGEYWE